MIHDSLIGSTTSSVSKKNSYCVSKMSSPSILIVKTEMSKRSAKFKSQDFYPKNFNHESLPRNHTLKATGRMSKEDMKMTIIG
jgi:hypothetical protein